MEHQQTLEGRPGLAITGVGESMSRGRLTQARKGSAESHVESPVALCALGRGSAASFTAE